MFPTVNETVKVLLRPYTTVKLILKTFKNPSFRRSTASSGIIKNIPRREKQQTCEKRKNVGLKCLR